MEVLVGSKHLLVDVSCALDVTGREHLVVVVKGTFQIPVPGQRPRPLSPQAIEQADVFLGDPDNTAMLYGSDMVRFKPRCDVLFHANAHAPAGQPVQELNVVWQVGPLRKGLKVHGRRHWKKRFGFVSLEDAKFFTQMPLHYGMAFGGTRTYKKGWGDKAVVLTEAQLTNPIGIGWFGSRADDSAVGEPAPSLEALNDSVRKPGSTQQPVAFSAIARHWLPRLRYGGTYDEKWQRDVFPFLPDDFDEQFHQCAPSDQQMPYPVGGEQVILRNMMPGRPDVRFKLPKLNNVTVRILRKDYSSEELNAVADTLYFEPDESRFSIVWRASTPIMRHLSEIRTVGVGPVNAQLWQEKTNGADSCAGCGSDMPDIIDEKEAV